jgi:putative oxidoreductase
MKNLLFGHFLGRFKDTGLLLMRVGLGLPFVLVMGRNKLFGGTNMWEGVGGRATALLGMESEGFLPILLGFMASITEFFGGLLLIVGLLTRPAAAMLGFTMFVAFLTHLKFDGLEKMLAQPYSGSWSLQLIFVFAALAILGAGRLSRDYMLTKKA